MPGRKRARNDVKVVTSQHNDEEHKRQKSDGANAENLDERSRTANPDPSRSIESLKEGGDNEQLGGAAPPDISPWRQGSSRAASAEIPLCITCYVLRDSA